MGRPLGFVPCERFRDVSRMVLLNWRVLDDKTTQPRDAYRIWAAGRCFTLPTAASTEQHLHSHSTHKLNWLSLKSSPNKGREFSMHMWVLRPFPTSILSKYCQEGGVAVQFTLQMRTDRVIRAPWRNVLRMFVISLAVSIPGGWFDPTNRFFVWVGSAQGATKTTRLILAPHSCSAYLCVLCCKPNIQLDQPRFESCQSISSGTSNAG